MEPRDEDKGQDQSCQTVGGLQASFLTHMLLSGSLSMGGYETESQVVQVDRGLAKAAMPMRLLILLLGCQALCASAQVKGC